MPARRPLKKFYQLFTWLFLLAGFLLYPRLMSIPPERSSAISPDAAVYTDIAVVHVYDGDTFRLANGEKVRLIGIDTPESSENKKLFRDAARSGQDAGAIIRMGRSAAAYARKLLAGRKVRLEFDVQTRDKYGRLLAYAYRSDDGLFINEDIIRNGYAYPMAIPPNIRHADHFRKLFRQARKAGAGLWAGPVSDGYRD